MPFSIRLRVHPIETQKDDLILVRGMRPEFFVFGPPPSASERGTAKAAKLEFIGRFLEKIRTKSVGAEASLGELTGQMMLAKDANRIVFECDPDSLAELAREPESDEDDENAPPRFEPDTLEISLAPPQFENLGALEGKKPRLVLPRDAGQWHHLEVFTKLTVDGTPEADFELNDILDVPLRLILKEGYPFSL